MARLRLALASAVVPALLAASCASGMQRPSVAPSPRPAPAATSLAERCHDPRALFYEVTQTSMEPTLLPGDHLLLDTDPRTDARGEIVVFSPPPSTGGTIPLIARLIGLPGDSVDIRDGHMLVDGREISEPYVDPRQVTGPEGRQSHWSLSATSVFVLGDDRQRSLDSRSFGAIPLDDVLARAVFRCSPAYRAGDLVTPSYSNPQSARP